jgi:hypothetical protein
MTDNFLHNLRNQGNKRFDRNRGKSFDGQFRPNDRFAGRDRKGAPQRKPADADQLQSIKRLLEGLLEQQRRLVELGERTAGATERLAEALEGLARGIHPAGSLSGAASDRPAPAAPEPDPPPGPAAPDSAALAAGEGGDHTPEETAEADPRQTAAELILTQRARGQEFEQIAQLLNQQEIPTLSGKGRWRAQSASRLYNTLVAADTGQPSD